MYARTRNMIYSLLGVTLLMLQIAAQCPLRCKCPDDIFVFELRCNNASLTDIPEGSLEEALFFDLSENNITVLKNNSFVDRKIVKLVRLYLDNNGMKTIEVNAFRGLTNLQLLNLGRNDITTIPSDAFEMNTEIEALNLDGNSHLKLPDDGFHLPNLDILSLKECGLSGIPVNFFKKMIKLQYIFLRRNQLSHLDPQVITPLTLLRQLDLRENKFIKLQPDLLQILPDKLMINFNDNPFNCDCELQRAYRLYKNRKYNEQLRCTTPTPMSLNDPQLSNCANSTPMVTSLTTFAHVSYVVTVSNMNSSLPSSSITTFTPPIIPIAPTNATVNNPSPEDKNIQVNYPVVLNENGINNASVDSATNETEDASASWISSNRGWVALSGVIVAMVVVIIILYTIRRRRLAGSYPTPRRFSRLEYDDDEENCLY